MSLAPWIAHLRVAEDILAARPDLAPDRFLMGTIAPDAGTPGSDGVHFYPPPGVTHFQKGQLTDAEAFRRAWLPAGANGGTAGDPGGQPGEVSFRFAYYVHLLADTQWYRRVVLPTIEDFGLQSRLDEDPTFFGTLRRDWYDLDRRHLAEHPECVYHHRSRAIERCPYSLPWFAGDEVARLSGHCRPVLRLPPLGPRPRPRLSHARQDGRLRRRSDWRGARCRRGHSVTMR